MGSGALYRDFIYPPFSILDARSGWWTARKKQWLELGIESEKGRSNDLLNGYGDAMNRWHKSKNPNSKPPGDWATKSVFDPVLCELAYAWFSPQGGKILDPFAGGSVRGIVASKMGRPYTGIDISEAQIDENKIQAKRICEKPVPEWRKGNAARLYDVYRSKADFIFTCPPYGYLERYSKHPDDLSNMSYDMFIGAYRTAIKQAAARLKPDRFAAFVVGDFRGKNGAYNGFVGDTISACKDAGLLFYNEAVLVTQGGSLPLRARGMFEASRKLGKTHQNLLVFIKGCPKTATQVVGNVETYKFTQN